MNRLHASMHLGHGSVTVNACFGELLSIQPMTHVKGAQHDERIRLQFRGAVFEFEAAAFAEVLARGPEALSHLPIQSNGADVSGSVAQIAGDE